MLAFTATESNTHEINGWRDEHSDDIVENDRQEPLKKQNHGEKHSYITPSMGNHKSG